MTGSYYSIAYLSQCSLTQCSQQSSPDNKTKQLKYYVLN
jgi:hypothetical protein